MSAPRLLVCGLFCAASLGAVAQSPRATPAAAASSATPTSAGHATPDITQPLTEKELMQQLDSLGKGDPLTKLPRGADTTGTKAAKDQGNGTTEITAKEAAFDQKTHTAVFIKEVFVENPDFTMSCDKLTAFMHNDQKDAAAKAAGAPGSPASPAGSTKATGTPGAATPAVKTAASTAKSPATAGKTATAAATPAGKMKVSTASSGNASMADRVAAVGTPTAGGAAPEKDKKGGGGGLERAIGEGTVVITQDKVDADGSVSHNVGHSRRAVYVASTGDITLTGNPDVQQGINTCIALADSTVMVLNRNGKMNVTGPHKTIIRDSGSTPASAPSASNGSAASTVTADAR